MLVFGLARVDVMKPLTDEEKQLDLYVELNRISSILAITGVITSTVKNSTTACTALRRAIIAEEKLAENERETREFLERAQADAENKAIDDYLDHVSK